MGISSLQVCIDSSNWFQGTFPQYEDKSTQLIGILDSTSSPMSSSCITPPPSAAENGGGNLSAACILPRERQLRPPHDKALPCPRCESTNTKFCYYNNYSLSQPRYFCKSCRRYWTKGGTLRNIPVGGGCRKPYKKPTSSPSSSSSAISNKSSSSSTNTDNNLTSSSSLFFNPTNFSDQMNYTSLHAALINPMNSGGFIFENSNATPFHEFIDNKYEALVVSAESNFEGGFHHGMNICSPFGINASSSSSILDHGNLNSSSVAALGGNGNILESWQRLMLPLDQNHNLDQHHLHRQNNHHEIQDVKPSPKILSLEWHEHNNFGGLGSWTGLMNGYGSSATNPLV